MSDTSPRIKIRIKNDSGRTMPEHSIIVVTSVEETAGDDNTDPELINHATRYGCGTNGNVFVTGKTAILPSGFGAATADPLVYVSIDTGISPPVPGEEWGPVDDQWYVTRGGRGFFAQGVSSANTDTTKAVFLRTYVRDPASICSSFSSSSLSSSSGSGGSASGSGSSSSGSNCITVVTNVQCSSGSLIVTYGNARKC